MFPEISLDSLIVEEGIDYSETSLTITNNATQHPGSAKASIFQVFTKSNASSHEELRRKINRFNDMYLNYVKKCCH